MKIDITHFYSDWNGSSSKQPYFRKPTQTELAKAVPSKMVPKNKVYYRKDRTLILITPDFVEVRRTLGNDISYNRYRDLYRIEKN